jgi:putative ABC transport system permease protein
VQSKLKDGGRTTGAGAGQNRWRAILAVTEVSLALILLVGSGLMMKSLNRLLAVDPGFHSERVITMEMSLRTSQYDKDISRLNFWQQVVDRVHALPGVEGAALGTAIPLTDDHSRADVTLEGMALPKPGSFPHPDIHIVSPGYVRTLGVQLMRGREFVDADTENARGSR